MSSKKKQAELREEKDWERIDNAVIKSENFLEKHGKKLLILIGVAVVIACAYMAYNQFYLAPKTVEAQAAIYKGQQYYENGQDSLAIFGDANGYIGFEAIISEYGSTKTGNLAKGYAGICYARMGNTDKALDLLKSYSQGSDKLFSSLINGTIGDCLVAKTKAEEAAPYFEKAARSVDNAIHSPVLYKKAALIYRDLGKTDKVVEIFTIVKDQYRNSPAFTDAEKYLEEAAVLKAAK